MTGDSEARIRIGRWASNGTGHAQRNSPRCCHITLLPRIALRAFARWPASRPPRGGPRKSLFDRNSNCATPTLPGGFERPKLMPTGKRQLFSFTDECEARPFTDDARDFRTRFLKIHKRYRPAMGFTDKRVSHDQNAYWQGARPVHKLFCNVLISRTEFRSRNYISGGARRQNI